MGLDPKNQKYRDKPKRSKRSSERSKHHPSRRRGGGGYRTEYPAPILRDDDLVFGFGNSNAGIIAGKNRVDELDSGFGGLGKDHCGELYLVAGVGRGEKETHPTAKFGGIEVATHINNKTDAAFIKISEMSNIDHDLGYGKGTSFLATPPWKPLAAGSMGQPNRHSAIGMSADGIRICGDEGLKLITKRKRYNSKGELNSTAYGVDLIAGNDMKKSPLQPMVKGDNLVAALKGMNNEISALNGIVHGIIQQQMQFNMILMNHFHFSPFFAIPTTISVGCFVGGVKIAIEHVIETIELILNKLNGQLEEFETAFPFGKGYICSKYHYLN